MATLTTTPILARVAALVQDPTNVRWPKPELLAYLSDGQRELCLLKPDARAKTAVISLVADTRQVLPSDGVVQIAVEILEIFFRVGGLDGDLAQTVLRPAVDRDARAIGAPIRHGDQHVRQHGAKLRLQLRVLQKQPYDATHGFVSFASFD